MGVHLIRSRLVLIPVLGILATVAGSVSFAAGERKDHVLGFSGEGSAFVVKEPPGWFADTTIAREFGAEVIFYPAAGDPHSSDTPIIRVRVTKKTSEDIQADLIRYAENFRSRYRSVELRANAATHPIFRAYSKRFCVQGKLCEYVTYLDPGPDSRLFLSVILVRPAHPATAIELAAYQRVVASLDAN